ncbi:hypothetical protein BKA64DRAFT_774154 [Cadophora sp. MPI-SDFR-AT-0126]|nr:hypothetical protein BKA64DRAFT_774154 [Leotiomycetes sp. MPI-SDFR-AT-0126]
MHLRLSLPTILVLSRLILASPMANHDTPTPTLPKRVSPEVSILPVPNPSPASPPRPSTSATLQELLAFCASGSVAANIPAVQQFCKLISGFVNTAGEISGGSGLGGGLGGILPPLPPIPGRPVIPGLGGSGILPSKVEAGVPK